MKEQVEAAASRRRIPYGHVASRVNTVRTHTCSSDYAVHNIPTLLRDCQRKHFQQKTLLQSHQGDKHGTLHNDMYSNLT